jgi:ABC-type transporter Mla maintaining outer membrane lipid asymmetry ATPase subunit MlaF
MSGAIETSVVDVDAGSAPIILRDATGVALLEVVPGSGATYRVVVRDAASCEGLIADLLLSAQTQLVARSAGLVSNISVLENVVLPAVYHGRVARTQLAERVYREFHDCGVSRADAEVLCTKTVAELTPFERRLTALVRALMMRPSLLLMERLFEGLPTKAMQEVARFPEYYRRTVPDGTVVIFDLAGMMCPQIAVDFEAEA